MADDTRDEPKPLTGRPVPARQPAGQPGRGPVPVAPPAHGTAGAATPAPPEWSYRSTGAPLPGGPATPAPLRPNAGEGIPTDPAVRSRPTGAPALPGPVRTTTSSLGPSGRRRSPLTVVALSAVTLGVYALIWHDRINEEVSDFDPRMQVRAGASTLAVAIAWLLGLLISLAGAARILLDQLNVALPFNPHLSVSNAYFLLPGIVATPYLVLALPFSVVAVVMTLERIRVVEDRVGLSSDRQLRPTRYVWWLVVPVVGGLVMIAAMQRRLNRVWELAAPRPSGIGTIRV